MPWSRTRPPAADCADGDQSAMSLDAQPPEARPEAPPEAVPERLADDTSALVRHIARSIDQVQADVAALGEQQAALVKRLQGLEAGSGHRLERVDRALAELEGRLVAGPDTGQLALSRGPLAALGRSLGDLNARVSSLADQLQSVTGEVRRGDAAEQGRAEWVATAVQQLDVRLSGLVSQLADELAEDEVVAGSRLERATEMLRDDFAGGWAALLAKTESLFADVLQAFSVELDNNAELAAADRARAFESMAALRDEVRRQLGPMAGATDQVGFGLDQLRAAVVVNFERLREAVADGVIGPERLRALLTAELDARMGPVMEAQARLAGEMRAQVSALEAAVLGLREAVDHVPTLAQLAPQPPGRLRRRARGIEVGAPPAIDADEVAARVLAALGQVWPTGTADGAETRRALEARHDQLEARLEAMHAELVRLANAGSRISPEPAPEATPEGAKRPGPSKKATSERVPAKRTAAAKRTGMAVRTTSSGTASRPKRVAATTSTARITRALPTEGGRSRKER